MICRLLNVLILTSPGRRRSGVDAHLHDNVHVDGAVVHGGQVGLQHVVALRRADTRHAQDALDHAAGVVGCA